MLTNVPRVVFEEAEEVSISNAVCLLLMVSKWSTEGAAAQFQVLPTCNFFSSFPLQLI